MRGESRSRAVSALVQHAKDIFARDPSCGLVAPISPAPLSLIQSVLERLALGAQDVVLDLGCGDGRWLIAAAVMTGCACRGVDLNESLLEKGRQEAKNSGVSSLVILEKRDIFQASLVGGTVVIVYLFREGLSRMKPKLEAESGPGVRVVSIGVRSIIFPCEGDGDRRDVPSPEGRQNLAPALKQQPSFVMRRGWTATSALAVGGLNVYIFAVPKPHAA